MELKNKYYKILQLQVATYLVNFTNPVCIGPTENRDVNHSTQESPPLGNAS